MGRLLARVELYREGTTSPIIRYGFDAVYPYRWLVSKEIGGIIVDKDVSVYGFDYIPIVSARERDNFQGSPFQAAPPYPNIKKPEKPKIECEQCFDEEGSYSCIRMAHQIRRRVIILDE